jgi:Kdo2-lipid IVA lauroyltransferase/acyltransferase
MRLALLAPRYWLTWAALGLLRLVVLLPFAVLVPLGGSLGRILRLLPLRHVRTARRNMELCLPEKTPAERERLLDAHFQALGIALMETAIAWWWPTPRLMKLVHTEGLEHLHTALERGRGVIMLTAHFTSLEMSGRAVAAVAPLNILYRPSKNEALSWMMLRCRSTHGGHAIPRDDIRALVTALKKNECAWYAPDQSYRKKGAEMVPLFGIPAATNTSTSRLARITGATVLPFFCERLPGRQGFRVVIHPPLQDLPQDSPAAYTERFNHLIEAQVRIAPEQYLWIHRRFKGLTPDYPDYYAPRRA